MAQTTKELREFLAFLQELWTLLAGVSVLFPLSNTLIDAVPMGTWPDGGFVYLSPVLVSACATIGCLFLVLWTFGTRDRWRSAGGPAALARAAIRSLAAGGLALAVYLVGVTVVQGDFYFTVLGWPSDALQRVAGDLLLAGLYGAVFVLITRAFLLLGLREYLRPGSAG